MRRILIVDEDVNLLSSLKSALKKLHYNVIVTTACREVFDILFFFEADLICIGISPGREEGIGLAKLLKSRMDYQHIPVLILPPEKKEFTELVISIQSHIKK